MNPNGYLYCVYVHLVLGEKSADAHPYYTNAAPPTVGSLYTSAALSPDYRKHYMVTQVRISPVIHVVGEQEIGVSDETRVDIDLVPARKTPKQGGSP